MRFDPREWRAKLFGVLLLIFLLTVFAYGSTWFVNLGLKITGLFAAEFWWVLVAICIGVALALLIALIRSKWQSWRWKR